MKETSKSGVIGRFTNGIVKFVKMSKQYLYEVRAEVNKITWPERDKATKTTYVVLIFIVIVTAFLGLIDVFFSKIMYYLFHI